MWSAVRGAVVAAVRRSKGLVAVGAAAAGSALSAGTVAWATPAALPTYTADEVALRDGSKAAGGKVWVTVGDAVLDVTEFAAKDHPGGDFIYDGSGGPVEGFWAYWAFHYQSPKVRKYTEKLRIGTLVDAEPGTGLEREAGDVEAVRAMYADDDPIDKTHHVLNRYPYSTQTQRWAMASSYTTANDSFYIRNHAPVPTSAGQAHEVEFVSAFAPTGSWTPQTPLKLSLKDLRSRFPRVTVTSVLQCCGNRAKEMIDRNRETAFSNSPYETIDVGMMGNATWSGYALSDVLLHAFPWLRTVPDARQDTLHVHFFSHDGYTTSTPLRRALLPEYDALLATHMNGEELPPHHGAPVRVVLPGIGGARNVKWVNRIEVHDKPSSSGWTKVYYKDTSEASAPAIQQLPMQSLMLSFMPNQAVSVSRELVDGAIPLHGIAWGGGSGAAIVRVDVSVDDGATWSEATLLKDEAAAARHDAHKDWGWVRWTASISLPDGAAPGDRVTMRCRATDADGNCQPDNMFVPSGYLYNGHHVTTIRLVE